MKLPSPSHRLAFLAVAVSACAHAKPAEVVATVEAPNTIVRYMTIDTARLAEAAGGEAGTERALAALIEAHLATVGQPRGISAGGDYLDVVADLPAPGYALRARITPKSEMLCAVTVEPLGNEQPLTSAPWSVHDALSELTRGLSSLTRPRRPAMSRNRFARLHAEASAAAHAGRDPALTPEEYVRVPRSISNEGDDAPYHVPPQIGDQLRQAP
jgi:hypothetical protein